MLAENHNRGRPETVSRTCSRPFPITEPSHFRGKRLEHVDTNMEYEVYVRICGGVIEYLAKRECDGQICSLAKTLNHVVIG